MPNRCAIYVRKSTEHGLDMEFNSLQNQEESCKAYIASQAFNGWQYHKTYTDAAISGGTMERPALKQMLDDMAHGLINTVVVYKVDRLSRSILDFHNMMRYFEKYGANFVSITQSFDTSTSMGKLTLNMLLSFAQFEREVSSERVRDKIRASKAKGLWMGGNPHLGYDIVSRKLVVNEKEAGQVRHLFEKYLELQSVNELTQYAVRNGIYAKKWQTAKGITKGGRPIPKMSMHRLLRDRIYIGQIENKVNGTSAPGEHQAIIPLDLFNRVQTALQNNANHKSPSRRSPNILTGKLFNHDGTKFKNQHTCGKGKINCYYYAVPGFYLPAPQVDEIAVKVVGRFLDSDMAGIPADAATVLKNLNIDNMLYEQKRHLIQAIVDKVVYSRDKLIITINTTPENMRQFTDNAYINQTANPMDFIVSGHSVTITEPVFLRKYVNTRFDKDKNGVLTITDNNHLIVKAFATAWKYRDMYEQYGNTDKIIAMEHTSPRQFYRHLDLAYMNPDKINPILSGRLKINVNDLFQIARENQLLFRLGN